MPHLPGRRAWLPALFLALLPATAAFAQGEVTPAPIASKPPFDPADTAFVLICSALVLFMTPGLALFYGGLTRRKNVLGTMMQSFIAMGLVTVLWVLVGYSLAFGPGNPFIGGFDFFGLNDVSTTEPHKALGTTIPQQTFMAFQLMFAIITPALISGAFAERMKFSAYLWFIGLWLLVVYCPIAHWVWSDGGWLFSLGALDFAGGTVVHISSGVSALVACILIGKRRGYPNDEMRPHNLTMTVLGTAMLWFGWYGFNAGSALAANNIAVAAFVNTHIGAATAAFAWMLVEWAHRGKPTVLGAASGAVAGLVGITPAAGFVNTTGALIVGAATAVGCYFAVMVLKSKLKYDDSLDTFGVHGVGGTIGAILTGLLAVKAVNAAGSGLFDGKPEQLVTQLIGVGATWGYAAIVSLFLLFILDRTIGLRVKPSEEESGLDISQHGEEGYVL